MTSGAVRCMMLQPPLAVATIQFVFCLVFLASEGAATVDDSCTDVSYWDVLKYQTTTKQCCKTKLKQICTFKSDHVCEEVPEIQCEVVSWPLCESTPTLTESKKCEVEYQDYPYINCKDVKSSITHTRKVPECKEVISENCVTDWKVNANGNKVWGGTETCTPVRWEECEIVERQVELPMMRTECATGSTIKWADVVDKTKHVAGLNTRCQVKSSVDCKKKAVTKCASVSWEECSMVPVDECQSVVVYTPSQEKIHRKSCFNPNIPVRCAGEASGLTVITADAITNNEIGGVVVKLLQDDVTIEQVTTDSSGVGLLAIPLGLVVLEAERDGFAMAPLTFTVGEEECEMTIRLTLSDTLAPALVVLSWIDPIDLDLHTKQINDGWPTCHCFWDNVDCNGFTLDLDSSVATDSAETISWSRIDAWSQYLVYVDNYESRDLSGSKARVVLYRQSGEPRTVYVPENGSSDRYWKVACFHEENGWTLINELVWSEPNTCY